MLQHAAVPNNTSMGMIGWGALVAGIVGCEKHAIYHVDNDGCFFFFFSCL